MIDREMLIGLTEGYLKDSSNYLVGLTVGADNTIIIEVDSDRGVNIDDCVALSRYLESKLDRDAEDFELTVTSAGLTSPLKTVRQYKKYEGQEVEVVSKKGEKLTGVLKSSDEKGFTLRVTKKVKPKDASRTINAEEDIFFAFDEIKHTKYLIRFK